MLTLSVLIACLSLALVNSEFSKRSSMTDRGDYILICEQEPIELGIVLDSSSSIRKADFQRGIDFLKGFLHQFDIGHGENDVRVSIITFGQGIYTDNAFDLTTYDNKEDLLAAIGNIRHKAGMRTDTGLGIEHMHTVQFAPDIVRPYAEKVGLVITDGNSQLTKFTKQEAESALADNITMFALGVGSKEDVKQEELENIAGDVERVIRVDNYRSLSSVKKLLASKTCIKKKKPSTLPPINIKSCGEISPADINFVFSPADLGIDAVAWSTSFISHTVDAEDMYVGFRYGLVAGDCPDDAGFVLDKYGTPEGIIDRIQNFDRMRLPSLTQQLREGAFSVDNGGRDDARKVAVLFSKRDKGLKGSDLEAKVRALTSEGVRVFIANPAGYPIHIDGATALQGRSSRQQSEEFISYMCYNENIAY